MNLMLTKKQVFLMILALLSIAAMVVVLLWQKRIQQQFQNPELMTPSEASEKITTETSLQNSGIDFLMSDFESLLSGNDLETLYQ
jgi:hypothetical protein